MAQRLFISAAIALIKVNCTNIRNRMTHLSEYTRLVISCEGVIT